VQSDVVRFWHVGKYFVIY